MFLGIFPVYSAEEQDDDDTITVKVGYYENEVFQEGASEGAVKKGYAYEYYFKLSEYTGWKYEYVYGDFNQLYQKLKNGEVDLLAGLAYKPEREAEISYPDEKMGSEILTLIKHSDDDSLTEAPSTLNGKSVGVLDSAVADKLEDYFASNKVKANIERFQDYESIEKAFFADRLDAFAAEGDGVYTKEGVEVLSVFGQSDYYLCVNKSRPDLLSQLNSAQKLLSTQEPSYITNLNNKYYTDTILAYALTPSEKEWLSEHDSLCVGYLDNYLPYCGTDKNGKVKGLVKDYIPEMLKRLDIDNMRVSYRAFKSYDDMIAAVNSEEIDVAFPVGGGAYYSEENGIYQTTAVVTPSKELIYKGEYSDDLTTHFALNRNNNMQSYYVYTHYPDAEISYYDSPQECLRAVASGKAKCTTLDGLRSNDMLKNREFRGLSMRQLNINEERSFGIKIGNEGLLRLFNRGVSILGKAYAHNLAYRYTDGLYTYTFADVFLDNIVLFVVIILAVAAVIIFFLIRSIRRRKKQLKERESAQIELEKKNEELANSKEALAEALTTAEQANHAKTNFLNNMSHDIRTPMNAIVGFTAMAAAHLDNKEQVQDYLKKISISSRHLLSLINDVLDMSRIESGKMKIDLADVHLPDIIHDLWTIIQSSVRSKNLDIFIDTKDVVNENIITDKLRLNQVLLNILTNAVKFTPPHGTISFRVIEKRLSTPGMTNFEFRIRDTGIGMSEEFQKTIFDAFTREQNTTVSGIQGTGLGMAITKNIVDLMGGTITVKSSEGKGSEFTVNLPFRVSENAVEYKQLPELEGLRTLVADDDTDTCLSICSMLRGIGMRPDWTNYGKEAVVRAKEAYEQGDHFSAFIIDFLMPDLNGIETVRRIRKVIGDDVPIIILTAYDWTEIEAEARAAGVTGFCSKPLFMSELRNALSKPFMVSQSEEEQDEKAYDFTGKKILLAEDNEMNRLIAISILEEVGFEIDIAEDGVQAVEAVENNPANTYYAVLMDIQMPRMDGYEAAKKIRAMEDAEKANVPIIAVTANAFEEDRKIALEAGMNGHLAKPYDIPMMMETLEKLQ